jgi:hypothetical protein
MPRSARYLLIALSGLLLAGCKTSEIKNETDYPLPGLSENVPTATAQSGYGDGKGDSVGGGGGAPALDAQTAASSVRSEGGK